MDFNIENNTDKQINIGNDSKEESVININYNSDNALIGVDLLANTSKKIEDITDKNSTGYNSGGEESVKSNKEDFNFFDNDKPSEEKNIKLNITDNEPKQVDPIIENKIYGDEFKSIHSLSPNEIKNEKQYSSNL